MYNHAPDNYVCPLCLAIEGTESDQTMMKQADIIYRDDVVMAAVNSKFIGEKPGHAIVVPVKHYENLYDLPDTEAAQIMQVSRRIALGLKTIRQCDGIMIMQNNEPASWQHAFHYHMHVFPRYENDDLLDHMKNSCVSSSEERLELATALKKYLAQDSN